MNNLKHIGFAALSLAAMAVPAGSQVPTETYMQYSNTPAMSYSVGATAVTVSANRIFQHVITITDSDQWIGSDSGTIKTLTNNATSASIVIGSGTLYSGTDGEGNPVPNPSIQVTAPGTNRITFTLKAMNVTETEICTDTLRAWDNAGDSNPPNPNGVCDNPSNIIPITVTVDPPQ